MISLNTDHWIWGEHDGFLRNLAIAIEQFEASSPLKFTSFDIEWTEAKLKEEMQLGTEGLSWLNSFKADELRSHVKKLIVDIFSKNLPKGWRNWGFKEILYGLNNNVPELLLDLFPGSKIAFTFREPISTLHSMVCAWLPHVVDVDEIRQNIKQLADRWFLLVNYFLALKIKYPNRVIFIPNSYLKRTSQILQALDLDRHDRGYNYKEDVNLGRPHPFPQVYNLILKTVADNYQTAMTRSYHECLAVSI